MEGKAREEEEEVTAPAQAVLPAPKYADASRSPGCCLVMRNRENTSIKAAEGKTRVQRKGLWHAPECLSILN